MSPANGDRSLAGIGAAICAMCAIFSGFAVWSATERGIGLFGDSVDYIASARQIAVGHGAQTLDGKGGYTPLTQFPPGYPLLIATMSRLTGQDAVAAARPLHLFVGVTLIVLMGWLAHQATGAPIAAAAACVLGAVSQPLLMIDSRVYSEGPFLCAMLLAIGLLCRANDLAARK